MTFATDLAAIPYAPKETQAKGFLPPIARAIGHTIFVLEAIAAEREIPAEEMKGELTHAQEHWHAINHGGAISATTIAAIENIGKAFDSAVTEFDAWNKDQRVRNLRDLYNRVAAYTATLDRELLGLRDSDPGHQL